MIIPEGVNYLQFYAQAKMKGIRITSRFRGVHFNLNGRSKSPSWLVMCRSKGKDNFLGRFPFTAEGEIQAGQKYQRFLEENGLVNRCDGKRKYKIKS